MNAMWEFFTAANISTAAGILRARKHANIYPSKKSIGIIHSSFNHHA